MALSASGLIAGKNPVKVPPFLLRAPRDREGVAEEGERGVLVLRPAPTVLAVDDPRLVGVQPQANLLHPRGDPAKHILSLSPLLQCTIASSA